MRKRSGFTLVEVMISLGVMTVGAMSIVALQQQTTRANVHARELSTATQIAQNVVERLKLDGVSWNTASTTPNSDLQLTYWLKSINGSTPGAFGALSARSITNAGVTRVLSNAFDYYGNDVDLTNATTSVQASVHYCVGYRLSWIYNTYRAMRADVRVFWSREAPSRAILGDFGACADDNTSLSPGGTNFDRYHIVYLSTVIRPAPI
jgi:prepilin-type N-terminal cleavage/methylation domain-containing protein